MIGLMVLLSGLCVALAADPVLPPGVAIDPLDSARRPPPPPYRAAAIVVDWTHPLLKAELASGMGDRLAQEPLEAPQPFARLELKEPAALRIQMIEPEPDGDRWRLALPLPGGLQPVEAAVPPPAWLSLDPLAPWLPGGVSAGEAGLLASPLASRGPRVAARWLAPAAACATAWPDSLREREFRDRCLLSLTHPAGGRTRFICVFTRRGETGRLADLREWLLELAGPDDWIGLHSLGPLTLIGAQGWRLVPPADPRQIERAGLVLELRGARQGEPVDWARLARPKVLASSFETDFPPDHLVSGRFWPTPLAPVVWMSRLFSPGQPGANAPPWVEMEFPSPRRIDRVVVVWASAAGWSGHFNPAHCRMKIAGPSGAADVLEKSIEAPAGPVVEWTLPQAPPVERLRLEFPRPAQLAGQTRACLAAIQMLAPWDGKTLPR